MTRPAVFLDRDGTMIVEHGYLDELSLIEPFPWTAEALRLLHDAGYAVIVVTNQAGVARGYFSEALVPAVHARLDALLAEEGAHVDGYYYCPHHPDGVVPEFAMACDCRKPSPGMIRRAASDLGLDVARSYVVGDRWLDVELAQRAGATGLLVRTGYGSQEEAAPVAGVQAAAVFDTLLHAAHWIAGRGAASGAR